ncbi:ABC transporter permease [Nitriliruptor alkaliphilus]|uniref:ABC transporter permease n=1 Tax=Nitriliruptor alkaliphilus TaxID=427918 RepID=UPI000698ADAC|nr:ABC transporter permease [Nitriliruptor alkaliphilus]
MGSALVRIGAFVRGEVVATMRQPRLLLTLVVGPFLVLFVFGLGYDDRLPDLRTLVVGGEGELTDQVDEFIRQEQPVEIDYRGTTDDERRALDALRDGEVDLVIVLPDDAVAILGEGKRALIRVHQRSLDPVTYAQIEVASRIAISEINDQVLEEALASVQDRSGEYADRLAEAREQLDRFRAAVDDEDIAAVQRTAGQLGPELEQLADVLEQTGAPAGLLGFGGEIDQLIGTLRDGARQLDQLSSIDGVAELDDAQASLAELDEAVTQLRAVDASVVVRPFASEVVSQTPVPVTIDRFYAPGLVALMLQHLGITFAAFSLVRERRTGTLELLRVSPVSTGERLAGKSLAFLFLGGLAAVALTALIVLVFDVPAPASWLAFALLIALTLLASIGLGFVVAAASATESQAVQLSMLLFLAAIFFSGLFMPLDRINMPVEAVSWLLPATYAFLGLQRSMLLGDPAGPLLFIGLAAIALVTYVVARLSLSRRSALG